MEDALLPMLAELWRYEILPRLGPVDLCLLREVCRWFGAPAEQACRALMPTHTGKRLVNVLRRQYKFRGSAMQARLCRDIWERAHGQPALPWIAWLVARRWPTAYLVRYVRPCGSAAAVPYDDDWQVFQVLFLLPASHWQRRHWVDALRFWFCTYAGKKDSHWKRGRLGYYFRREPQERLDYLLGWTRALVELQSLVAECSHLFMTL